MLAPVGGLVGPALKHLSGVVWGGFRTSKVVCTLFLNQSLGLGPLTGCLFCCVSLIGLELIR